MYIYIYICMYPSFSIHMDLLKHSSNDAIRNYSGSCNLSTPPALYPTATGAFLILVQRCPWG